MPSIAALLAVALLAGCGSVSHANPGQSPTPTPTPPGATPSPTPVVPSPTPTPPGPTPSPSPTPSAANAITGRVVDPSGVPVVGTVVVDLELGGGDFFTFRQTTADAQGNFRFNNVPPLPAQSTGYAIMVAARAAHDPGTAPGAPGSFYAPALLLPGGGPFIPGDPIVPGTNVGTIQLRFVTAQGDIEGTATSTDSSQKLPIPVHVKLAPMRIFTLDFVFDYPWIGPAPSFNTGPGAGCPAGTACGSFQLPVVPESPVEEAIFSKSGYTFSPSQTAPNFILTLNATSLLNGKPDCNPSSVQLFANTLNPDAATNVGNAAFAGCQ